MKKAVFIGIILFLSSKAFSQADETFIEEKSSEWIKISVAERPVVRRAARNRTAASPKKETPVQQPAPEQRSSDVFDKTNRQVKRFKKEKE